MGNNIYIKRFDIGVANGWVKLSDTRLIADVTMQAVVTSQVSIRADGGPATLLTNGVFRLDGVDLSRLEISTASAGPVGFMVFGNTTRS